jgi:hypothetical protein
MVTQDPFRYPGDASGNRSSLAHLPYIEWIPIGALRPNPRNPRTHSKKQIKQIAASIKKFGFLNPVLVDDANMVLAGHGRLEAAKLENLTHVPIIRFDHLTEVQKRAYLIADNKIAEQAGWDRETLAIEFGELIDLLPAEGLAAPHRIRVPEIYRRVRRPALLQARVLIKSCLLSTAFSGSARTSACWSRLQPPTT